MKTPGPDLIREGMYTAIGTIIIYAAVGLILQYVNHVRGGSNTPSVGSLGLDMGCSCKAGK